MMNEYLGQIALGMDVCDMNGKKVGRIAHIYHQQHATVGASAGGGGTALMERPSHGSLMEVKTGLFGLGEHLYIPTSAIHDVVEDCVFVGCTKGDFDPAWHHKPEGYDEF